MSQAVYTGTMALGMVTIPIAVYKCTDEFGLEGHLYHQDCNGKIREQRFCELHPAEIAPVAFSGVQIGDQIVPITSEIRNLLLDRKVAFNVLSSHPLKDIPDLMMSDEFMPCGVYEVAPQKGNAAVVVTHNRLFGLLQALKLRKRYLLCEVGLGGMRRLAALLPNGRIYILTYREEIRDRQSWSGMTNRKELQQLSGMVMSLENDFPEVTLRKYSLKVGKWFTDRLTEVKKAPRKGRKKSTTEKVPANA